MILLCELEDPRASNIHKMLSKGEKCACCLLETLKVTQPTLSHHMSVLVKSGMVNARKEGKWQYYSINCEKFSEFKEFISSITCCECDCHAN
ncbi:MAG: ArsR/SmtB family transcription factor [Succinivibrio sp.]